MNMLCLFLCVNYIYACEKALCGQAIDSYVFAHLFTICVHFLFSSPFVSFSVLSLQRTVHRRGGG